MMETAVLYEHNRDPRRSPLRARVRRREQQRPRRYDPLEAREQYRRNLQPVVHTPSKIFSLKASWQVGCNFTPMSFVSTDRTTSASFFKKVEGFQLSLLENHLKLRIFIL